MSPKLHRDTIYLETAEILAHQARGADQYLLRLHAPRCAARARPGHFVHLECHPLRPLRRPLSIMRSSPQQGWVELLYKVVGEGTRLLSGQVKGGRLSLLGPIGRPFEANPRRSRPLLIGGGVGMPPMVFLADSLRTRAGARPLVILGSEVPFPFPVQPSKLLVPGIPEGVIGTLPLLDDWQVPCRLTSLQGLPGCHQGYVTDLARHWIDALDEQDRLQVEIFACGPHPMLEAVARLARDRDLPCQVSLEEFMACGVGGCAGCVVEVNTASGTRMQRVCVDGPVFDARQVFP